jgi:hypothetical protein
MATEEVMMSDAMAVRAAALLAQWAGAVERYWHGVIGDPSMGCYGPGYIHWGVQSNWNYAAAMATLAGFPGLAGVVTAPEASHWRERALSALRFVLATHVTGDRRGNDGHQWGHSWISMLGIERGMHGAALLADDLTEADRAAARRVVVSEASWLLHHAHRGDTSGIVAGRWNESGCNVPESNIWSGALLWRAAQLYPRAEGAAAWMERAHTYFINGVSVPADAEDQTVLVGKPVAERYVGANYFPNYALDHHGYLNVGYMVICVSNAAMPYSDMRRAGLAVPETLMHHQTDLWQVLRRMIFGNGRLARIGGDSRVRYSYCQEYLLPALLFAADALGDPHALDLAEGQLSLIEHEMEGSDDGTFYGRRMGHLRESNPHYFTRLESDRAVALSMLVNYLPLVAEREAPHAEFEHAAAGGWVEPEHGAVLHRSPARFASFAWRARGLTQGLCLPPNDVTAIHMTEWARNLAPVVRFLGDAGDDDGKHRRLIRHHIESYAGGFATCGIVMEGVDIVVDEGAHCTDQATTHLAFVALPDGQTCVGLQLVIAAQDRLGYLIELKGLHLNVANDCFNDFQRSFVGDCGEVIVTSPPDHDETLTTASTWLAVEGAVGVVLVYGSDGLVIDRAAVRRGGRYRSLYVEELCSSVAHGLRLTEPGEVLIDIGFVLLSGGAAREAALVQGGQLALAGDLVRGIWVVGRDGVRYEVVADFAEGKAAVTS